MFALWIQLFNCIRTGAIFRTFFIPFIRKSLHFHLLIILLNPFTILLFSTSIPKLASEYILSVWSVIYWSNGMCFKETLKGTLRLCQKSGLFYCTLTGHRFEFSSAEIIQKCSFTSELDFWEAFHILKNSSTSHF